MVSKGFWYVNLHVFTSKSNHQETYPVTLVPLRTTHIALKIRATTKVISTWQLDLAPKLDSPKDNIWVLKGWLQLEPPRRPSPVHAARLKVDDSLTSNLSVKGEGFGRNMSYATTLQISKYHPRTMLGAFRKTILFHFIFKHGLPNNSTMISLGYLMIATRKHSTKHAGP